MRTICYISVFCFLILTDKAYSKEADSLEIIAYVNLHKNNYNDAIIAFSKLISNYKNNTRYLVKRGECYYAINEYEKSKIDFLKAESDEKGIGSFYLAKIYTLKNNNEEAFNYLKLHLDSKFKLPADQIQNDPVISRLQNDDAWKKIWQEDWYSGREKLYNEINYLKKYKKYEEALDILDTQFNKGSKSHKLFALKASIYEEMQQYKLSVTEYNNAIKGTKRLSEYYIKRAEANFLLGNYDKAMDDYLEVMNKEPYNIHYYKRLAQISFHSGEYDKANEFMNLYLKYYSDDVNALYWFGNIYHEKGSYLNALKYYNKVIKQQPNKDMYYLSRGKTYLKTKTYQYAENDFSMALDLNPNNSDIYLNRGSARLKQGKLNQACNDWEKAVKFGNLKAAVYIQEHCK